MEEGPRGLSKCVFALIQNHAPMTNTTNDKTAAKVTLETLIDALESAATIAEHLRKKGTSSDAFHASQCERQLDNMVTDLGAAIALRD